MTHSRHQFVTVAESRNGHIDTLGWTKKDLTKRSTQLLQGCHRAVHVNMRLKRGFGQRGRNSIFRPATHRWTPAGTTRCPEAERRVSGWGVQKTCWKQRNQEAIGTLSSQLVLFKHHFPGPFLLRTQKATRHGHACCQLTKGKERHKITLFWAHCNVEVRRQERGTKFQRVMSLWGEEILYLPGFALVQGRKGSVRKAGEKRTPSILTRSETPNTRWVCPQLPLLTAPGKQQGSLRNCLLFGLGTSTGSNQCLSTGCNKRNLIDWASWRTVTSCSQFWTLKVQDQGAGKTWLLVRAHFLASGWSPSPCVLICCGQQAHPFLIQALIPSWVFHLHDFI